jgi:transcriptional regulator with XRE-family HTH domain
MAAAEKLTQEYSPMAKGDTDADKILRLMKENRWSQRALADKLGISQPMLHKLLKGKAEWKMSMYRQALEVLGTSEQLLQAQNGGALAGGIIGVGLDKDLRRRLENVARRMGQGDTNGRIDLSPVIKMAIAKFVAEQEAGFSDKK